jgi:predicted Rossmann-fold nucleotide-binding protein
VDGFYEPLAVLIERMVREGFLSEAHRDALIVEDEPERLVDRFRDYVAPPPKWTGPAAGRE